MSKIVQLTMNGAIEILANNHIISASLSSNLQKVVTMRNVLVHQYLDIDFKIVWNSIDSLLVDAPEFVGAIQDYLKGVSN